VLRSAKRATLAVALRVLAQLGKTERATRLTHKRRPVRWSAGKRAALHRWGVKFDLNLDDNVQRTLYYTGWYERPFLEFLRSELRKDDVFVDVGAHVGIVSAYAAQFAGRVFCFEPAPDSVEALHQSLARLPNVVVLAVAVGEKTGTLCLRTDPGWHAMDASTRSAYTEGDLVCMAPMIRFDEWSATQPRVDIVKIDVEGGEANVLRGMSRTLGRLKPRVVIVELSPARLAVAGSSEAEIARLLCDYQLEAMIGQNAVFRRIS